MGNYDLKERTERFAVKCRNLIRALEKDTANEEDCKQLARASGSVAANYIELNEAVGKKDRIFKARLCMRESKESRLWLSLMHTCNKELTSIRAELIDEAIQLVRIFNAIIIKLGGNKL
jgi:four helix bundle protein